jgi:hypothetical protein
MKTAISINHSMDTEALTNTDGWWEPIDEMRKKITDYNYLKGLKTIMGGAWTYDKLVQNAIKKGVKDVDCLSVVQLIEIADCN